MKHSHQNSFDCIIIMMTQCDLVAAQFLCFAVEITPAHSGTEITRILFNPVNRVKYTTLKNSNGDSEQSGIVLNKCSVFFVISWIHHKKNKVKMDFPMPLDLLEKLGHKHGVFSSGDTYSNPVTFGDQLICLARSCKRRKQLFMIFFPDAVLCPIPFFFQVCFIFHPRSDITHIAIPETENIMAIKAIHFFKFPGSASDLAIENKAFSLWYFCYCFAKSFRFIRRNVDRSRYHSV